MRNGKTRKWGLFFFSFFMGIIMIYNFQDGLYKGKYIYSESKVNNAQFIPCNNISQTFQSKESKLYELAFFFKDVPRDDGKLHIEIFKEDKSIYVAQIQYNELKERDWTSVYTNIPLQGNQQYKIVISHDDVKEVPQIGIVSKEDAAIELVEVANTGKCLAIRCGYYEHRTVKDKIEVAFKLIVVYCLLTLFPIFWEYIGRPVCRLFEESICWLYKQPCAIVLEIICHFTLFEVWCTFSGNKIDFPIKACALVISIISMKDFQEKVAYWLKKKKQPIFVCMFVSVVLYSAFTVMGSQGIIYPLNSGVTLGRIFVFGVAFIWFLPVIVTFLSWYEGFGRDKARRGNCAQENKFLLGSCILILAILPVVALIAFNPGIVSEDTVNCLAIYAHNIVGMPDWHPPFYILCLKLIISIWDSTYAVVLVQILFWLFVMFQMLAFLRRQGIADKVLLIVTCIIGTSIPNAMYLCSIWKDIPYGISLLWLSLIIARIVIGDSDKLAIYIELIISLVFVCLFRQNGIVPYIVSIVSLGIILRNSRKVLVSLTLSICMILLIRGPLYSALEISKPEDQSGGKYIGLSQEIMGVYYSEGDISENTLSMINVLSDYNVNKNSFNPYWANSSYKLEVSVTEFMDNYLNTLIRNPIMVIREIFCRNDCIWHVFPAKDALVNLVNYQGEEWGDQWQRYYPNRINNRLTGLLGGDAQFSADSQLYNIVFWRSGLHVLIIMWCVLSLIGYGKRKEWLIFIPLIGQIISLLLSTGWSDFRYYWPINIMAVFLFVAVSAMKIEN